MGFRASPLVLPLLWPGFGVLAAPGLSTPGHVAWQWPPWARPCLPPSSSQHKMCERTTFLSDRGTSCHCLRKILREGTSVCQTPPGWCSRPRPREAAGLREVLRIPLHRIKWVLFIAPTLLTKTARVSPMPATILGSRAGSRGIWLPSQRLPMPPPGAEASATLSSGEPSWAAPEHSLLGPGSIH